MTSGAWATLTPGTSSGATKYEARWRYRLGGTYRDWGSYSSVAVGAVNRFGGCTFDSTGAAVDNPEFEVRASNAYGNVTRSYDATRTAGASTCE